MAVVAMKQLLEAGVHFGHQTRRWDPRMAEYIFQARNGIHIIDLQKTSKKLDEAYSFVKEQAEEGKTILFVGTKKQAQECVKEAAESSSAVSIEGTTLPSESPPARKLKGSSLPSRSIMVRGLNPVALKGICSQKVFPSKMRAALHTLK